MVRFLDVFSADVKHDVVNIFHGGCNAPLPPRMQRFVDSANPSDQILSHITVPHTVVSSTFISNHDRIIKRAQCSRLFSFFLRFIEGVAVDWIFFDIYMGIFLGSFLKFCVIFSISRNYFFDFRKSQKSYVY